MKRTQCVPVPSSYALAAVTAALFFSLACQPTAQQSDADSESSLAVPQSGGSANDTDAESSSGDESETIAPSSEESADNADDSVDIDEEPPGDESELGAADEETLPAETTPDAGIIRAALTLNSVIPNSGPTTGGQMIRLVGAGFAEGMEVQLAGRMCLNLTIESGTVARCMTPEGLVGIIPVIVTYVDGGVRETTQLDDGYTYFAPVGVTAVEPQRVPARGGVRMTVRGTGFIEGTRVRIDGQAAPDIEIEEDGASLSFSAPPHAPGTVDVSIENVNGQATAPDAVVYYESLVIAGVVPPVGPALGGDAAQLIGSGLAAGSLVSFVPNLAQVGDAAPDRSSLDVTVPPGVAGPATVAIENENGTFSLDGGYVYFDDLANGFQVAGIVPNRGPLEGGNDIWVAGNGFSATTSVTVGGRMADCTTLDPNRMRCVAPPGEPGQVAVNVIESGVTTDVPEGYTYFRAVELVAIEPDRGSIAGGTLVTLTGRGFDQEMEASLGESVLVDLQVIDDSTAVAITPANTAGPVDVALVTPNSQSIIIGGYRYFDPTSDFGGVWGEQIVESVNVTVIDGGSGARMPEAAVIALSTRTGVRVDGLTDMNGQATLSEEGLTHPLNVTAAKEGFEATTIEDVMVENVTVILFPNDGEGGPPDPIPLPTIAGTVTGLDELPKAIDDSSVNVIVVETSHTGPTNRSRLPDPGPGGILYEDGPFTIMARPGELAVIATAGTIQRSAIANYQAGAIDYWAMRRSLRPIAMGIRRFVSASPGEAIVNIDVTLDHPLDFVIPVDLDNPPRNIDTGPQRYAVLPSLNLGPEGFWELDTQAEGLDATLTLNKMPRLDGWDQDITYYLIGLAFSLTPNNMPYSICLEETRNVDAGVFIGPFVGSTKVQEPAAGGILDEGGRVTWTVHDGIESPDFPIAPPSANLVLIEEPALGPPKPLWRYVTPSDVNQFIFPDLPEAAGEAGLGRGQMYLTIMPFIIEGENFDFEDFTYDALNMGRWKSWSVNTTTFLRAQQPAMR